MRTLKLLVTLILINTTGAYSQQEVRIIPQPSQIEKGNGCFSLNGDVNIIADDSVKNEASYLASVLEKGFGQKPNINSKGLGIVLKLDSGLKKALGEEGYKLSIEEEGVIIEAANNSGIFYGIQSFLLLQYRNN